MGLVRGGDAGLRGKGSGWDGSVLGLRPPPISSPVPSLALKRTCAGLSPSPGGSRRAALGDQRTQRSWAQGEGAGNFPPRLPGPVNLPLPRRGEGGTAGGIPSCCDGSSEPELGGLRERKGRRERDRLGPRAQLPSSPDTSCLCLSRTECPPLPPVSRVREQGEWHFLLQARGFGICGICGAKGVRIPKRVCVSASDNEWVTEWECLRAFHLRVLVNGVSRGRVASGEGPISPPLGFSSTHSH